MPNIRIMKIYAHICKYTNIMQAKLGYSLETFIARIGSHRKKIMLAFLFSNNLIEESITNRRQVFQPFFFLKIK